MRSTTCSAVLLVLVALGGAWPMPVSAQPAPTESLSLYWINQGTYTIVRANVEGSGVNSSFINDNDLPYGVAVDANYIYWSDSNQPTIARANLDGGDVRQTFIHASASGAFGVAVDSQYIYWADGGGTIGRATIDGSDVNARFITIDPNSIPLGVRVDAQHIYWTLNGETIGRANLDGSNVNTRFISGTDNPAGLAIDALHIYWVNASSQRALSIGRANLDGTDVNQNFITGLGAPCDLSTAIGCGWGLAVDGQYLYWPNYALQTIGRANVDGGNVNQSFITGANYPLGLALSAPTQPVCLQAASAPPPPLGGATFARPLVQGSSAANVVVLPSGASWKAADSCTGIAEGAQAVMTQPTSVRVAPGAGVLLRDASTGLLSAWGARLVEAGNPPPVLYPGRSDWQTTEADVLTAQQLLASYAGCPACQLPNNVQVTPGSPNPAVAYQGDVSNASFRGDTLTGSFAGWDFSGSDLRGAQLVGLQSEIPSNFGNLTVGVYDGVCTSFQNSDLRQANLKLAQATPGCEKSPLLLHSSVPLGFLPALRADASLAANVNVTSAIFVANASDRSSLAGQNLHGIDLSGTSFIGWPVDLSGTTLDGATLAGANLALAELAGASLHNVNAAGASFRGAHLAARGGLPAANFAGSQTNLQGADFVNADVSGASFVGANLSVGSAGKPTQFDHALARGTDFTGVNAKQASFNGAHIYGNGRAFEQATDLTQVDFTNALLAGDTTQGGGFDLTGALLTGAHFDGALCIACNFTGARLGQATFIGTYLPGAVFSSATLQGVNLYNAWLYCGDQTNSACPAVTGARPPVSASRATAGTWTWALDLGFGEIYGPVTFADTDLTGVSLANLTVCPNGDTPANTSNCAGDAILPLGGMTTPPIPCSADNGRGAAALGDCPTHTTTLFDASAVGKPLAVAAASPPVWATTLSARGSYVGLDDGTVRLVGDSAPRIVAGQAGEHCATPTEPCGDGGPATEAQLGTPAGLAVGLDGTLYIADSAAHKVRKVDTSNRISTVAGNGQECAASSDACGDGGPATAAALSGPTGVWVDPLGELWIADGRRGLRHVLPDGTITSLDLGTGPYNIQSVVGDSAGHLYATTVGPDYLLQVDPASGQTTQVVGTGTSGYNGTTDPNLGNLLPGNQVQIDHPAGLAVRLDGDVLFADTGNNLVRAYVPLQGHVIDLAGLVENGTTPQGGFNGDGQYADNTELNQPQSVTTTSDGRYLFWVADTANGRVRLLGPNAADTSAARRRIVAGRIDQLTLRLRRDLPRGPTLMIH